MSDRQTPTSVIDRVRACIQQGRAGRIGPSDVIYLNERDLRAAADETRAVLVQQHRLLGKTAEEHQDEVIKAAKQGRMYLFGVQVLHGTVNDIAFSRGGATRGVQEYRGDQHAGVDNSVQAAQGCRVAAGVSDGADLCTLGTADLPVDDQSMLEMLWSRRREVYARTGKLPTEFTLTPDQFFHLRAQVTNSTSYAVFNAVGEFGYMVFGIPVRVVAPTHGR